jgi:hypothetical protein
MSQEDMELVRSAYAQRWGTSEWSAWVESFIASDFELEDRTLPEVAQGLRGTEAVYAVAARMGESFEDVLYEIKETRVLDDGRVLVHVHAFARGRGSGVPIDGTLGHAWVCVDGRVRRLDVYARWDDALDAVGLSE